MENKTNYTELDARILQTLGYFDFFHYPLKAQELHTFLTIQVERIDLDNHLNELVRQGKVTQNDDLFGLPQSMDIFSRRRSANALAAELLPKAHRAGRLLARFPFVRFVGISGSLSKHYADATTDFDFFIITAEKRLWIARTLMHIFKKLTFLVNKQNYFCMNYFLDEAHLRLEDENRYTAIELATLIPVNNQPLYSEFMNSNTWLGQAIPNFKSEFTTSYPNKRSLPKWFLEACFNALGSSWLNTRLMELTRAKWKAKWKRAGYPEEDYDTAFRTREYVSKNHPKNYQKTVLADVKLRRQKLFPAK